MTTITRDMLDQAAKNLSRFVFRQAALWQQSMGFTYAPGGDAPETMDELRAERDRCVAGRGHETFTVWAGGSDLTIYTSAEANYAFRFWHDMIHLTTGLEMNVHDEVRVGMMQAERVGLHFGHGSIEYKLMVADTCGQSVYHAMHGAFPFNQREWVYATVLNQHH